MKTKNQMSAQTFKAELLISWVLLVGVISCASIAFFGILGKLFNFGTANKENSSDLVSALLQGGVLNDYHPLTSASSVLSQVAHLNADAIMTGALLLLIALPIIRVALTTLIFLRERDWPFVAITLIVFSVLISGILLGKAL